MRGVISLKNNKIPFAMTCSGLIVAYTPSAAEEMNIIINNVHTKLEYSLRLHAMKTPSHVSSFTYFRLKMIYKLVLSVYRTEGSVKLGEERAIK